MRTWHHTVFSSRKQRFHQPTLKKTSVLLVGCIKKSNFTSNRVHRCIHVSRAFFGAGLGSCPLLYIRTSCVSRDPVSYIVSAYLVSYCLLLRQQQRFQHPTLETTSVLLVGCIKKSNITSKRVHCCIHLSRVFFFGWDVVALDVVALCRTHVPRMCRLILCPML